MAWLHIVASLTQSVGVSGPVPSSVGAGARRFVLLKKLKRHALLTRLREVRLYLLKLLISSASPMMTVSVHVFAMNRSGIALECKNYVEI